MARAKIRNKVAMANRYQAVTDKPGTLVTGTKPSAAIPDVVGRVNQSDRRHKQSFRKNPPAPVPPSKNTIQRPRPVKGKK